MKKIDAFTNQYKITKTLSFSLIPQRETEKNFDTKLLLKEDGERAEQYQKAKKIIDRFHKYFIDEALDGVKLQNLSTYEECYLSKEKKNEDIQKCEMALRKEIQSALAKHPNYNNLFKKELVTDILPSFLKNETGTNENKEELKTIEAFKSFSTYFTGFHENRKNMYTAEEKPTAIAYRCINENLPKFIDNQKVFDKIINNLSDESLSLLHETFFPVVGCSIEELFKLDYFNKILSQKGISLYNQVIGGYACSDGTKIQGINEHVNLYNQQIAKSDKSKKLPLLKPLYKQILSDKTSISFLPENFNSDTETLKAIDDYYQTLVTAKENGSIFEKIASTFTSLEEYDLSKIYISSGPALTIISNEVFGFWGAISSAWCDKYAEEHPIKKQSVEKYEEKRDAEYKKIKSFSLKEIQDLGERYYAKKDDEPTNTIPSFYREQILLLTKECQSAYQSAYQLLHEPYISNKKLMSNAPEIEKIKTLLDNIKALESVIKPFKGSGKEEEKDEFFYGEFYTFWDVLSLVDKLYDKVRNYLTQKPYSKDKIKLNFGSPTFLDGWDKNKETANLSVLLKKDNCFFLAIMDKKHNNLFSKFPAVNDSNECYEKIDYKLLPGPNKMLPKVLFSSKKAELFKPQKDILALYKNGEFKKGDAFNLSKCHQLIDFYKHSISIHEDWQTFNFDFSPTNKYQDISQFYNDVQTQGYKIGFQKISSSYIHELVEQGHLYLFQIYNKDFSEYSKGKPNLHTLYFKMLFENANLKNVVYALNGGAEMFHRKASISNTEQIIHSANEPIENKNKDNPKKESLFTYDLIKDKRFTKRQFSLHLPITLNFKKPEKDYELNFKVRKELQSSEKNVIIGIDRGERHLLYISVINEKGEILEQMSLNEIVSDNNYRVNYHDLLDKREKDRDNARKSWQTIENIKELKEGYLSQVIHRICLLVEKYDAIIAMEDLNSGFKNSRKKVEKQVYQKFEKMLIDKLNYYVNKETAPEKCGGLLKAYQLTQKFKNFKSMSFQNGIIFYIPAWNTSKIDPTTGFIDLLKPSFSSVQQSKAFFEKFDAMVFDAKENMFAFTFDYRNFPKGGQNLKTTWTIYSNADRIQTWRNPAKNNQFDSKFICLTDAFKELFSAYNISLTSDIKEEILKRNEADFFKKLTCLFKLTLQLRNSSSKNNLDYLISPVKNKDGVFYDSRQTRGILPDNADANGAYNIARKALWSIELFKQTPTEELEKVKFGLSNKEWLAYAQKDN